MKCRRIEEIEVWLANHGHWAAFKWLSFISSSFNMPFTSIYYFCNSHLSFHEKPWCQNAISLIWCCGFDLVSFPSRTCLALSGALYLNCSLRCSWSSGTLRSPSYWIKLSLIFGIHQIWELLGPENPQWSMCSFCFYFRRFILERQRFLLMYVCAV